MRECRALGEIKMGKNILYTTFVGLVAVSSACAKEMTDTGIVKWFNSKDGYGFIKPSSGGGEVFVHFSTIVTTSKSTQKSLNRGDSVIFRAVDGKNGQMRTIWVKLSS